MHAETPSSPPTLSSAPSETRKEDRKFQRVPVELTSLCSAEGPEWSGTAVNLSREGCAIHSTAPVQQGDFLRLLIFPGANQTPIEVGVARVRWAENEQFGWNLLRSHHAMRPDYKTSSSSLVRSASRRGTFMAILIVDDSRDEQDLLSTRLGAAGYGSLMVADSAEAAFEILGQVHPGQGRGAVDLILMDIMLPGVDGLEACRRITTTERLQDIPIIVITAKTDEQDLLAAFTAGAMDYIRNRSMQRNSWPACPRLSPYEQNGTRARRESTSCSLAHRNSSKRYGK